MRYYYCWVLSIKGSNPFISATRHVYIGTVVQSPCCPRCRTKLDNVPYSIEHARMMQLLLVIFFSAMLQAAVAQPGSSGQLGNDDLPKLYHQHLRDMKRFFCLWCVEFCRTSTIPPNDFLAGASAADRPFPLLSFDPSFPVSLLLPSSSIRV